MELIDKSAVVAEIERLIETNKLLKKTWKWKFKWFYRTIIGRLETLEGLKAFIDTLEVKEVDTIEREVKEDAGGYPYIDATELYDYDNDKPLAKAGDKIKVVFIKDK